MTSKQLAFINSILPLTLLHLCVIFHVKGLHFINNFSETLSICYKSDEVSIKKTHLFTLKKEVASEVA